MKKLLIITQKVEQDDPVLGFFISWINRLAPRFESIEVVCLSRGEAELARNVRVHSLGKENGASRVKYVFRFLRLVLALREHYDSVFVHMNQEYILMGGPLWKIMGKRIAFWRNHQVGNKFTDWAVKYSDRVFCTSTSSYTARFDKTRVMPVGIDTLHYSAGGNPPQKKNGILFLGRMDRIKRPDILLSALLILRERGVDCHADFVGDPSSSSRTYYNEACVLAKRLEQSGRVAFHPSVTVRDTPSLYRAHGIYVNLTPSGSFDKTILEAISCGCLPIVANTSLRGDIPDPLILDVASPEELADCLTRVFNMSEQERAKISAKLRRWVLENHSLSLLVDELALELNK